jgi:hypothetical protein
MGVLVIWKMKVVNHNLCFGEEAGDLGGAAKLIKARLVPNV